MLKFYFSHISSGQVREPLQIPSEHIKKNGNRVPVSGCQKSRWDANFGMPGIHWMLKSE